MSKSLLQFKCSFHTFSTLLEIVASRAIDVLGFPASLRTQNEENLLLVVPKA